MRKCALKIFKKHGERGFGFRVSSCFCDEAQDPSRTHSGSDNFSLNLNPNPKP